MGRVIAEKRFDILDPVFSDLSGMQTYGDESYNDLDYMVLRFSSGASYLVFGRHFDVDVNPVFSWTRGEVNKINVIFGGDRVTVEDVSLDAVRLAAFIADGDGQGFWNYVLRAGDRISGSPFNDRIYGYGGDDTIDGRLGRDVLHGGAGSDTLYGYRGADTLDGGSGPDFLTGGSGEDVFLFDTGLGGGNVDHITWFIHADDTIRLDDDVFAKLATGANHVLPPGQYRENTSGLAVDADDRIIYNKSTGELYYDPDGTGPSSGINFAVLNGSPDSVDQTDFVVVT